MAFEGLTIDISANTAGARASIDRTAESLEDLSGQALQSSVSLGVLSSQADEAENEISEAGRAAAGSSATFSSLALTSSGLSTSLGLVSSSAGATAATLGAVLVVAAPLAATVATLAAGAAGLAAGFGAVIGLGVIGNINELAHAFQTAKEEIIDLVQPLSERFAPLLFAAIDTLPDLVENILNAIGPLGAFRDALVDFGQLALEIIPMVVGGLVGLGREALPLLRRFVAFVRGRGAGAFGQLRESAARVGPELIAFGQALLPLLPAILDLGTTLLEVLLPPLTAILNIVGPFATFFADLPPVVQQFGVAAGLAASGIGALAAGTTALAAVIGAINAPILAVAAALGLLFAAYKTNFLGIKDIVDGVAGFVIDKLKGILEFTQAVIDTVKGITETAAQGAPSRQARQMADENPGGLATPALRQASTRNVRQVQIEIGRIEARNRQGVRRAAQRGAESGIASQNIKDTTAGGP